MLLSIPVCVLEMVSLKLLAALVQLSAQVFARPAAGNATANATAGGSFFFKGYDLSSLQMLEEGGAVYHDSARQNVTRPADDILGDGGMNTVRLRYA